MFDDKQSQKAGDNSQLIQANTINFCTGIDEKQARKIFAEQFANARKYLTKEAYNIANERVKHLENRLLPKMQQLDNALNAFVDPAFQFLLSSAQKTAAATEREADYDMLSELLVCHLQNSSSRKTRTGISRAVEIIDKIDDDALCALTIVHAIQTISPISGFCKKGLHTLNNVFENLLYMDLPNDTNWIEHLDILDAVRINPMIAFNKIEEYYPQKLEGYSTAGIEFGSINYKKALELLSTINISPDFLISNDLLDNYVKIPISSKEQLKNLNMTYFTTINGIQIPVRTKLEQKQVAILESVWELYTNNNEIKNKATNNFMTEWNKNSVLQKIGEWWNNLSPAFEITHVGKVLAHANAQRCDKSIPNLSLPI